MREAQRKLEEAKRDEAAKAQEEAKEELIKAKAELEEILRQLREEEIARTLALLESRFRKMWEAQVQVYETTMRLDQIPDSDRGREFAIRSNNLSGDQRKILVEADKALLLLREEGSSIAFTESVEQIRDEMEYVSERLANVKVDFLTQESEEEIIATLEEMIEALQQAQKELEDSDSKPPPPGPPPPPGEDPLVDQLAELRMIRSLQKRVYTRTKRYARMLKSELDEVGQAETDDLVKALFNLSRREDRIREIVRDIHLGRNK
ncbi:MAG TPA: hypothetical protein EYQ75_06440 [Planctomycetaceae bacterium]|nr:hypothetical protein [Planctomycetaceae bacterium]